MSTTNNERIIAHNLLIDQAQAKVDALPTAGTIEDLTAVLNEQDALITELETVLAGKAAVGGGGGASVETCTVNITCSAGHILYAIFTCFEDGQILTKFFHWLNDGTVQSKAIENVVCDSGIHILCGEASVPGYNLSGIEMSISNVSDGLFATVTAGAGETATIEYYNQD